ncbi:MAG: hypothetical protein OJI67_00960 [Prosthecobacter sp.]|nr:hypothetical protein [Prosthecobacter sp.]
MDVEEFFEILQGIEENKIEVASFTLAHMGLHGMKKLCKAFELNTSLRDIGFFNSGITREPQKLELLAEALIISKCPLTDLIIEDDKVSTRGTKALAKLKIMRPEVEIGGIKLPKRIMDQVREELGALNSTNRNPIIGRHTAALNMKQEKTNQIP